MARENESSSCGATKLSQNKIAVFFACIGILGLIAVSLHLSAPAVPKGELWKNGKYVAGSAPVDEAAILSLLGQVRDPEVDLTVPELGLIYKTEVRGERVYLLMTLTTPTCPWSQQLLQDIRHAVFSNPGVAELEIAITFDPPWTLANIDKDALARLQAKMVHSSAPHIHAGAEAEKQ